MKYTKQKTTHLLYLRKNLKQILFLIGGVDNLNPIELSDKETSTTLRVTSSTMTSSAPGISPMPLPPHIENLDKNAIMTEGNFKT